MMLKYVCIVLLAAFVMVSCSANKPSPAVIEDSNKSMDENQNMQINDNNLSSEELYHKRLQSYLYDENNVLKTRFICCLSSTIY